METTRVRETRTEILKEKRDAEKFLSIWSHLPKENPNIKDKENIVANCDFVLNILGDMTQMDQLLKIMGRGE
jgi:hypothetical protein